MNLKTLALNGPEHNDWLNPNEQAFSAQLLDKFEKLYNQRNVEVTPSIMLRTWEVTTLAVVAKRTIRSLAEHGFHDAEPKPEPAAETVANKGDATPKPQQTKAKPKIRPAVDMLTKIMERMRKALGELEAVCNKMGTPIDKSEIEELAPIMQLTDDVLREAYGNDDDAIERARRRAHGYTQKP